MMMTMVDDYDEDGDNSKDEVDYNDDENDDNDGNKNMVKKSNYSKIDRLYISMGDFWK